MPVSKMVAFIAPNMSMSYPELKEGMFHLKGVFAHQRILLPQLLMDYLQISFKIIRNYPSFNSGN